MSSPTPDANFRRASRRACNLGSMGRGAGHTAGHTAGVAVADTLRQRHPVDAIRQRLRPFVGLGVGGYGVLDASAEGHPAGTPYVDIQADSALERVLARRAVEGLAGVTELAWEHGWRPCRLANGERGSELRIYPRA